MRTSISPLSAFFFAGRFSVTIAVCPSRSNSRCGSSAEASAAVGAVSVFPIPRD
jgi:hypothetical protein